MMNNVTYLAVAEPRTVFALEYTNIFVYFLGALAQEQELLRIISNQLQFQRETRPKLFPISKTHAIESNFPTIHITNAA